MGCLCAIQHSMPDISHCATVKMPLHGRDQCSALLMCSVFVDVYVICGPCVMLYIGYFLCTENYVYKIFYCVLSN